MAEQPGGGAIPDAGRRAGVGRAARMEAGAPRHIKSLDRRRPKIQIEKDGAEVFLKPVMNLAADREKERKLRLSNLESGRPPGWGRITGRRIFRHDAHAEIRKSHGRKQSLSLFGFFQNIGGNRDVARTLVARQA